MNTKIMTKSEIRESIFKLNWNTKKFWVISYPDYNGGRQVGLVVTDEDMYQQLDNFEYVEFEGDFTETLRHLNDEFKCHVEPFHEDPVDWVETLRDLLQEAIRSQEFQG